MNNGRSVNVRAELRPAFAGRGAGSLLEIDAWIQSEIGAISPLVERLMRLIEGSHCITGGEDAVQLALREALNNAVVHGNRLDVQKLVHVRCRCKIGKGISLIVSDQGQGFDALSVPDSDGAENLEAEHGRGIRLMKFVMDEVSCQQRATTLQTVFGSDVRVGRVSVSRYRHCGAAFGAVSGSTDRRAWGSHRCGPPA